MTADRALEASITIHAPPERVWALVSDVRRTGEWSPECRKVLVWGGRRVRRGSWLTGVNRRRWVLWPTTSRIHLYDEGRAIGWTVLENRARWSYHVDPEGDETRLTERREAPDGLSALARFFATSFLGGVEEHTDELEEGIQTTLERIKAIAESR
jgi:uncharacterized protein YndB with AHSA1/START domain